MQTLPAAAGPWTGTSTELLTRSQDSALAPGTYVWQKNVVEVTPEAPVLVPAGQCGVDGTVSIPEVEGVEYTESREGTVVTVTAAPTEGFAFPEGATTSWTFDVAGEACPPDEVTPEAPVLVPAGQCGVDGTVSIPDVEGVEYTESKEGTVVTVTAAPEEGFVFPEGVDTEWVFDITGEECPAAEVFTVSFDLDGGVGDFPDIKVTAGEEVTLPSTVPTREGYTFEKWLPMARTIWFLDPGQTFTPESDLLLIAQWKEIPTGPTEPEKPTEPGKPTEPAKPGETLPTTGGDVLPLALSGVLLLGAGAAVLATNRNRARR